MPEAQAGKQATRDGLADTVRNLRWTEVVDVDDNTIPSASYANLRLSYSRDTFNGAAWNVALNVTNLLDRDSPIIASSSPYGAVQNFHND